MCFRHQSSLIDHVLFQPAATLASPPIFLMVPVEFELAAQEEQELDKLELESAKAAAELWADYVASWSTTLADM